MQNSTKNKDHGPGRGLGPMCAATDRVISGPIRVLKINCIGRGKHSTLKITDIVRSQSVKSYGGGDRPKDRHTNITSYRMNWAMDYFDEEKNLSPNLKGSSIRKIIVFHLKSLNI